MRTINTSYINSASGMPFKSGTMDHLQLAYKEITADTIRAAIGTNYDPTKTYRIYGAQLLGSLSDDYPNTEGAIFYNGEVYHVDAVGGLGTYMGDTFGLTISQTQYTVNADPVTFTDTSVHNIHDIKKMVYFNSLVGGADSLPLPDGYLYSTQYQIPTFGGSYSASSIFTPADVKTATTGASSNMNGSTLTFEESKSITFNTTSGATNSITLDPTGAKQGAVIKIHQPNGQPTEYVEFNATGGAAIRKSGPQVFGEYGTFMAEITYTGPATNIFIVTCRNNQRIEAEAVTSFYLGTYTDHPTEPIQYSFDGNRVFMSGRMNNSSGSSYNYGVTQSFMTLPLHLRPKKNIRCVLCGTGDINASVGSPVYANYMFMTCNIFASTGLVQLVGPFSNTTAFFKLEWDVNI